MINASQCLAKYGAPQNERNMIVLEIPSNLQMDHMPRKIYCNRDMVQPLLDALKNIKERGLEDQIKTYDGCFNIRNKRGSTTWSMHAWGLAVDINATWNKMGTKGTMTPEFVKCFTDAGFDWGGNWSTRTDPMHFQLKSI